MKKIIIIGNWKLNGNSIMISNFLYKLEKYFLNNTVLNTIVISPPAIYLENSKKHIKSKNLFLGAQNVDLHQTGAFTGEISVNMLKEIGVKYVIIGHSERRKYHQENNYVIAKKFKLLKNIGLIPILCIGETIEEKNNNHTELVCKKQIDDILKIVGINAFQNSIIAYEPIWAIGSGKSANFEYAQNIHHFIKMYISKNSNINYCDIIMQYGGSIDENNVESFLIQKDIDGVLLGGSALIYKKFIKIIEISEKIKK